VVEVRMREEDVVDRGELVDRQVLDAGARVEQDVVVDQERSGPGARTDAAATPQDSYLHGGLPWRSSALARFRSSARWQPPRRRPRGPPSARRPGPTRRDPRRWRGPTRRTRAGGS